MNRAARNALAQAQPLRPKQGCGQVERSRQRRCVQAKLTEDVQVERLAQQSSFPRARHLLDQPQSLPIGADQNVQPVVERHAVDLDPAGAPSKSARSLEHRDGHAAFGQLPLRPSQPNRRRAQRREALALIVPCSTLHPHAVTHVFHAIQSLRNGVSAMR